jgi:hypothetical protein
MSSRSSNVTPASSSTLIPPQSVDPVSTDGSGSASATCCLAVNQVPSPTEYHPQTGLVHGVIHRVVDSRLLHNHSTQLLFSLQTKEPKSESVILTAHKAGSGVYGIYNAPGDTQIATLKRFQTSSGMMSPSIWYSLETNEVDYQSIAIATILYDVPSVWKSLMEAPPRRAHMALLCSSGITPQQPSTVVHSATNIVHDPLWFGTACQESIRRHGTLDDMTASSLSLSPHPVVVLENVVPYDKPGGRVGLNMHGRGRHPSNKNMQLAIIQKSNHYHHNTTQSLGRKDGVACQFAKWDANVYHLDYAAPLTSLTAFGFAIAQMDL